MADLAWKHRRKHDFENAKAQCLGKRDKSFAGRIDPHAVEICGIINERQDYYTTSSCAGRCFMYRGSGFKATTNFTRFRISHEKVMDPVRFFDLTTIDTDPSGGGDPIRTVGQFDYKEEDTEGTTKQTPQQGDCPPSVDDSDKTIWLRFEPFILHVACNSLAAASGLMAGARPAFKNVGLTTWKESRYLVAIWGDEGLEMPLCTPDGRQLYSDPSWLANLVNERHERNWSKINRFCESVREMPPPVDDESDGQLDDYGETKIPRSYDIIGDVAYLHSIPESDPELVGSAIMKKNKAIKVVVARQSNLGGTERAPGQDGLSILAGADRSPLITTHTEYGIKCVVDLNHTFFSPRMGQERLRICQQVARGEHVLVLFAGVGMEALQIAGRTEASSIVAVELNEVAVQCAKRAHRMLERNKAVKCGGAAERLEIIEGDVMEVLPSRMEMELFDRVLAPRPKEGTLDGDLGTGDGGEAFLDVILPHLKDGGECHWYDFVADHEFPECQRTRNLVQRVCERQGMSMEVLHVSNAGSVAMRQLRVCLDFKVFRK